MRCMGGGFLRRCCRREEMRGDGMGVGDDELLIG